MYTAYLKGIASISEKLDEVCQMGGKDDQGMPTPYVGGKLDVYLDGSVCGHFVFEDEWVMYHDSPTTECKQGCVA